MTTDLRQRLAALIETGGFDHPIRDCRVIETHISAVLLTGDFAYKFKKPVDFGFLDFTSLAKRLFFCQEELRLNQRTAPDLYCAVVSVNLDQSGPRVDGSGPVADYAVKMRQFPPDSTVDKALEDAPLTTPLCAAIARAVAQFHLSLEPAPVSADDVIEASWSRTCDTLASLREGFSVGNVAIAAESSTQLDRVQAWMTSEYHSLTPLMRRRAQEGRIRECHGDLHCGNIVLLGNEPVLFDCIEFDASLRCIDVMSDLAFLAMDLGFRVGARWPERLLNAYLECTGDYEGLALQRFFQADRALIRAKVSLLSVNAPDRLTTTCAYLAAAHALAQPAASDRPVLFLTHGVSGSGKSTFAEALADRIGAIRIRSDVERKRLAGLGTNDASASPLDGGLYSSQMSRQTYARLEQLASATLRAGYHAIVDAAFLERSNRERFFELAERLGVPCCIVSTRADPATLRDRVQRRLLAGVDPSEANLTVLAKQQQSYTELDTDEEPATIVVQTDSPESFDEGLSAVELRALDVLPAAFRSPR